MPKRSSRNQPSRHDGREPLVREARQSKTIQELKAENKKLKRQVSRLEKKIAHYHGHEVEDDEDAPAPVLTLVVNEDPKCSKCGSVKLKSLELSNYTIVACTECGHREKKHDEPALAATGTDHP